MYPNSESLKSHIKDQIPLFDEAIRSLNHCQRVVSSFKTL
jgi:hypothetical protein